jgi:hypothetical protein
LPDRLAEAEQVPRAVTEPRPSLADTLARIVSVDVGDAVRGLQAGQDVLLEHHAARPETRDSCLDVGHLPGHLCVSARRSSRGLEQDEAAAATLVQKPSRSLLERRVQIRELSTFSDVLGKPYAKHSRKVERDFHIVGLASAVT